MTGWRVGAILGPEEMVQKIAAFTGISVACTNTVGQHLAITAFENAKEIMPAIYDEVLLRRDSFFRNLNEIFDAKVKPTAAGIYAFLPISIFGSEDVDSMKFCREALEKANVVMIKRDYTVRVYAQEAVEIRDSSGRTSVGDIGHDYEFWESVLRARAAQSDATSTEDTTNETQQE